MDVERRKIQLIKEVLNVRNEAVLSELETVLKKIKQKATVPGRNASIYDFVGILSKKEADAMRKVIEETSEQIHPDDGK